jgi:preprotein translocase subunit SecD
MWSFISNIQDWFNDFSERRRLVRNFNLSAREASYKGRGEFRYAPSVPETKLKKSSRQAEIRQTIAERKAQQSKENHE